MPIPLALLGGFLLRQGLMAGGRAIAGRAIQSGATRLAGRYLGSNAAGAVSKVIGVGRTGMAAKGLKNAKDAYNKIENLPGEAAKKALKGDDEENKEKQEESMNIKNKFYSELDNLTLVSEGNQGKSSRLRGLRRMKQQKKADAQMEHTEYLRDRILRLAESDASMTQKWLGYLANRGAGAAGSLGSGLVQGMRKGYTHSFGSGGREGRWGGTPIDVKKDGLLNTGSQLMGRGAGYLVSKLGKQAVTGANTLKAGFKQGQEKAKSSAILPQSRQGSWGGQMDWKGNLASNLGKLAGRGAGWLYGKATKKHDLLSKKPAANPSQAPQAPAFTPQNRDQRLQKRKDILNARRSGRLAKKAETESDRDRMIGNFTDSTSYRDMFMQNLSNMLFEAKKSGREIRKERQEKRRHAMTQTKHMKQTGIGWPEEADKETAERRFDGLMKGSKAKIRKSQERMENKQEESTMNTYDRIINILLEARIEDYLDRMDELSQSTVDSAAQKRVAQASSKDYSGKEIPIYQGGTGKTTKIQIGTRIGAGRGVLGKRLSKLYKGKTTPGITKRVKREESSTNWQDRIVDMLLESYLERLDETMAPHPSSRKSQKRAAAKAKRAAAKKAQPGYDPYSSLHAPVTPKDRKKGIRPLAKNSRQSKQKAKGEDAVERDEDHPSMTAAERNYGYNFNPSRSGF